MKTVDLILTPTSKMSRAEWLAFRSPLNHAYEFIKSCGVPLEYKKVTEFFNYSELWKNAVLPTLGGSESAFVMGLNQYKSSIEVYYEKVGVKEVTDFNNAAMFWGKELEEQIAEKWQYWDGNEESLFENFTKGKVVRRCRKLNYYVQNKNFPALFISLDRVINRNKALGMREGSLECKTIGGFYSKMWESGIPPMHLIQLQAQLVVCGFDHGEIAILKDGRDFSVLPFDIVPTLTENIISVTDRFASMVKLGIEHFILSKLTEDEAARDWHLHKIDEIAPGPDGSEAYKNYLATRYSNQNKTEIKGTPQMLQWAQKYNRCKSIIAEIEEKQTLASNHLKNFMGENGTINFGEDGKVTWLANAKGTRVLNVKVIPVKDELRIV